SSDLLNLEMQPEQLRLQHILRLSPGHNLKNTTVHKKIILVICKACFFSMLTFSQSNSNANHMTETSLKDTLLVKISNVEEPLPVRIEAIRELSALKGADAAADLKNLLNRKKPDLIGAINWDPEAVERIIDYHLI